MAKFAYLIFNIMTILSGVVCLRISGQWRNIRWKPLLKSYMLVSLPFIIWDMLATSAGHWGFNENYTLGLNIAGIPIEEILFFISVPFVCLSVYLVCKKYITDSYSTNKVKFLLVLPATALIASVLFGFGGSYTFVVGASGLAAIVALWFNPKILAAKSFWAFMAISFVLFFFANSFLTALPIVTYGGLAITGFRIGTIPIEDFVYNFALFSFFIISYVSGDEA